MNKTPEQIIENLGLELTHAAKTAELLQRLLEIRTQERDAAHSEVERLTAVADMYRADRIADNQKISEYKSKLKDALAERDEYYNRAVSMLYFIPSDSLVADLRKMYVDFKAWRAERLAMPEDK